jgi:putative transcriptional regulator
MSTSVTLRHDGSLVRVEADGRETPVAPETLRSMTEQEIEAAALADPVNPPLSQERLARLSQIPRVKSLRRALGLTQEQFAARYGIPVGTLRDWEQERSEPDQTARSYLRAIASDPAGVARALGQAA